MSQQHFNIIKRPVVTEKTSFLREEENQYVFEVATSATKIDVRQAVERIFGVRVLDVKTSIVRGKVKRMRRGFGKQPNWKKAIVHVHHEDDIPLFEGA